ncbi:MAG TPA: enoyl-CoA hydratase [Bacillota bacterium]|nr:enoyl-CoA hydratase [Bacillota bacterium]
MNYLNWRVEDKVAIVTINRPKANALSREVLTEIGEVFHQLEGNEDVRVVLLHGEGKFFSAGADIKEFTTIQSGEEATELAKKGQDLFEKIEQFPKPVIAAIHGAALGGGLELAMACHMRIVSETAKLGLPELTLGIIPGFAGTQRLPRLVGRGKALEMILSSEPISGKEAVQWGLAERYYPEETLLTNALQFAKTIAKKSPQTLKAVLELVNMAKTGEFYAGVQKESEFFGTVFNSNDAKEGVQAFIEKREPVFTGK